MFSFLITLSCFYYYYSYSTLSLFLYSLFFSLYSPLSLPQSAYGDIRIDRNAAKQKNDASRATGEVEPDYLTFDSTLSASRLLIKYF